MLPSQQGLAALTPLQYVDSRTYNMVVSVCAEAGDLRNALHAADMLQMAGLKMDTLLYTNLIKGEIYRQTVRWMGGWVDTVRQTYMHAAHCHDLICLQPVLLILISLNTRVRRPGWCRACRGCGAACVRLRNRAGRGVPPTPP